jgi:hypothetical protein
MRTVNSFDEGKMLTITAKSFILRISALRANFIHAHKCKTPLAKVGVLTGYFSNHERYRLS